MLQELKDSVNFRLMDLASNLNDTTVRLQDAPSVFTNVGAREVGDKIIFDYFQDNWPRLYDEFVVFLLFFFLCTFEKETKDCVGAFC